MNIVAVVVDIDYGTVIAAVDDDSASAAAVAVGYDAVMDDIAVVEADSTTATKKSRQWQIALVYGADGNVAVSMLPTELDESEEVGAPRHRRGFGRGESLGFAHHRDDARGRSGSEHLGRRHWDRRWRRRR